MRCMFILSHQMTVSYHEDHPSGTEIVHYWIRMEHLGVAILGELVQSSAFHFVFSGIQEPSVVPLDIMVTDRARSGAGQPRKILRWNWMLHPSTENTLLCDVIFVPNLAKKIPQLPNAKITCHSLSGNLITETLKLKIFFMININ